MKLNSKVKPSKSVSVIGAIVGFFFVIFGIVFYSTVSQDPGFSEDGGPVITMFFILFILVALAITIFYGVNFFSRKGISVMDVDIENQDDDPVIHKKEDNRIEFRLFQLEALKTKGLITSEEYQQKKAEILKEL